MLHIMSSPMVLHTFPSPYVGAFKRHPTLLLHCRDLLGLRGRKSLKQPVFSPIGRGVVLITETGCCDHQEISGNMVSANSICMFLRMKEFFMLPLPFNL